MGTSAFEDLEVLQQRARVADARKRLSISFCRFRWIDQCLMPEALIRPDGEIVMTCERILCALPARIFRGDCRFSPLNDSNILDYCKTQGGNLCSSSGKFFDSWHTLEKLLLEHAGRPSGGQLQQIYWTLLQSAACIAVQEAYQKIKALTHAQHVALEKYALDPPSCADDQANESLHGTPFAPLQEYIPGGHQQIQEWTMQWTALNNTYEELKKGGQSEKDFFVDLAGYYTKKIKDATEPDNLYLLFALRKEMDRRMGLEPHLYQQCATFEKSLAQLLNNLPKPVLKVPCPMPNNGISYTEGNGRQEVTTK